MLEVEQVRDVHTVWHVMSLALLNAGRELDEQYAERMRKALAPARVCAAVAVENGDEALGRLYTELGTSFHVDRAERDLATVTGALKLAGLDESLAEAWDSDRYDDALRASHEDGMGRVGTDVGTPIISVGDHSIFGPVVGRIPRGEEAGQLWDGTRLLLGVEGFFELKRTREGRPQTS
jgi:hypothetical protein